MNIAHSRRRFLRLTGAGACAAMLPAVDASAQEPPAVLRLLSGFPPGGTADAITRWLGEKLTGVLAKTALVDNKPGAGGRLAIESLKSMPPDGLTMLLCLVFLAVYGWTSLDVIDAMEGIPFTSIPVTQPALYWSLPAGAVLMAVAFGARLAHHVTAARPREN